MTVNQHVDALNQAYEEQLQAYSELLAMGEYERGLLEAGDMERLVQSLHAKQTILQRIDSVDLESAKAALLEYFRLEEFSIPKMIKAASFGERLALERLQGTLGKLVDILEKLEALEKDNEVLLHRYSNHLSGVSSKQSQVKQAADAYKRSKQMSMDFPKGEKSGNNS